MEQLTLVLEKMAYKVFKQTAQYDKLISNWLNESKISKIRLRYGKIPIKKAI